MALRNLTTQLMVSFSQNWIEPERERPIIERYPISRALLPRLEATHGNLLSFQRKSDESREEIAAIQREQARLDAEHDRLVRGIYHFLTGASAFMATEEQARELLELRELLLPDGLLAVNRSYADQGGEILLLQQRLSPEVVVRIRNIPTPNGNLYQQVEAWMRIGLAMRAQEERRLDVVRTIGQTETKAADVVRARNEWIRVVQALRMNLELDGASPDDVERIFRYLDEAEAKADRAAASASRRSAEKSAAKVAEAPLDEPPLAEPPSGPLSASAGGENGVG